MDRVRVQVLGPLTARRDGECVPLGGPKQRQVLACLLAARSEFVSVDALVEDLWPGDPPATAAHVISTYVSGLRRVLGDRIRTEGTAHALSIHDDDVVDAWQLEAVVARARALQDTDPEAALALLPSPIPTGDPFGGLAGESALVQVDARRVEEVVLRSAVLWGELELALGRHEEALPALGELCERHQYHEGLHAQRMLALYRAGRQVEALETFRALRATLADEFGVDPSASLTELELRILLQDDGLLLEPPHVLPTPVSSFVGRQAQVGEICAAVTGNRLVTVVGPGGVGKTRLAIEAARASLSRFSGGTWWVDLAAVDQPDRAAARIAGILGLPEGPGASAPEAIRAFLSPRSALLVLDNCEHLLPGVADLVGALLEGAPLLTMLATSRRPLAVPGEHRVLVDPMSLDDATRLFRIRARDAGAPDARLAGDEAAIARVCASLDRLPLAIEVAASRGAAMSVSQIADLLAVDPTLGGVALSGVPEKQRSLGAAIEWGYRLLTPRQQEALDRLSVFNGSFDLDAGVAVVGSDLDSGPPPGPAHEVPAAAGGGPSPPPPGVVDSIAALVDSSLLVAEPAWDGGLGYRMLETVRSYGRTRLDLRGATDDARRRHALHHLGLFEAAGWHRLTPGFADWMPRLEATGVEIAAALDWATVHLAPEVRAAAAPGLFEYWFRRGDPVPAYRFGRRLLEEADRLPPRLDAAARLCAGLGGAFAGDIERATTGLDTAIEVLEDDDDWRSLVWALLGRGQNASVFGDLATMTRTGHRILEVCADRGADLPRAYGLALLGEAEFLGGGDLAQARRYTEQAIEGLRVLRDAASLNIFGLGIAAGTCAMQGDLPTAERYAVEATTLPGLGWRATAYVILGGWVLHAKGETSRARAAVRRGVGLAHQMSLEPWERHGLLMLARIAAEEQQWEESARLFGAARPQPPWGQAPSWWLPEQVVRDALGADRFQALSAAGAALPLDQWAALVTAELPAESTRAVPSIARSRTSQ